MAEDSSHRGPADGVQSGGGSFFAQFTGNAAAQANGFSNFRKLGLGQGQTGQFTAGAQTGGQTSTIQGLPQNQTSVPVLPNYLGLPSRIRSAFDR